MLSEVNAGGALRDKTRRRALSLDALRGTAILGMVLSGLLPFFHNTLPPWMYHAQVPPPTHVFNPSIIGITWVDFVFPLFLFALGAAVPLAMAPRLQKGIRPTKLVGSILFRGALLLFFALYKQHLMPGFLRDSYGGLANVISLLAFVVLFGIFTRFPPQWPSWIRYGIRTIGWAMAILLLSSVHYGDGSGFTVHRHDIILVLLANVAVTTPLIWLCSPQRYTLRLCAMAVVLTAHLARRYTDWGTPLTELAFLQPLLGERIFNGIIWACSPAYQKYLLITLPGTIAGDVLLTWLRPAVQRLSFRIQNSRWRELSILRCVCVAVICLAIVVSSIIGLTLKDWLLTSTTTVALSALGFALLFSPPGRKLLRHPSGRPRVSALLFRALFTWGVIWLCIGLALYPYQGGIRKDPATLSYFFVTAGLAHFVLILFSVITEAMHKSHLLFLLIDNGQNPMIAYVAWIMVVIPVFQLVPVGDGNLLDWITSLTSTPWAGFGRAVALMLLTALIVSGITRLKVFWRT